MGGRLTIHNPSFPTCAGMLSPDGRCKTLDVSADGYTRAEAAVLLLLQSAPALVDSQVTCSEGRVALVLAGTAVNQDGRSSSLTAPHGPSQQEVVVAASATAGISPAKLDAVEMHGTGMCHPFVLHQGIVCYTFDILSLTCSGHTHFLTVHKCPNTCCTPHAPLPCRHSAG